MNIGIEIEVDGYIVRAYPDNDGGLWFWHPITGERKVLNE